MELPPRARRIRIRLAFQTYFTGTTSACAENTIFREFAETIFGNYLRVRGEYHCPHQNQHYWWELPPRARRIPLFGRENWRKMGTTSACAENTPRVGGRPVHAGNYLRVRGEYSADCIPESGSAELPPRARRIQPGAIRGIERIRNYLRVRGEYPISSPFPKGGLELPPRARRIPPSKMWTRIFWRTTSACAENTNHGQSHLRLAKNYLRVRGEYTYKKGTSPVTAELPPRARRIQAHGMGSRLDGGTTSACAENTGTVEMLQKMLRNYLRVRGEYLLIFLLK